jgi:glutaredoxin
MTTYERPVEYESIVLYDADCPYCSAATKALRHVDDLGALSWDEAASQSFLTAQFGEMPFAIILVDSAEDRVYVGKSAAQELATRAGLPDLVGELVENEFDRIEAVVEKLGGHEQSPDDFHGEYELTADAREAFEELSYMAWNLPSR